MEENFSPNSFIKELIEKNILIFSLILVGIVLLGIGAVQYIGSSGSKEEAKFVTGSESEAEKTEIASKKVTVDVAGEVQSPGVYVLNSEARLADAIEAAGGLSSKADNEYISKKLNLAQKVIDGGKIYIPAVGENAENTAETSSNFTQDASVLGTTSTSSTLININSASDDSLDALPKIGPVTAQKIINNRPYSSIEELVSKKVMTQKTFDGLKDRIVAQ